MARVFYGGIITDMKGSIGGTTFQANAAAKIAKMKSTRRKQNTSLQNSQMTVFQSQLPGWAALDQGNKDQWSAFALAHEKENKWGESKILTGINWFMSINNYLSLCGETPLTLPPVWETPLVVQDYTPSAVYNDFSVNWSPSFDHSDHYLLLFTSPLLKTVSQANRKVLRLTSFLSPDVTSSYDFLSDWQAAHNIPVPIPGSPSKKFLFLAILSIHSSKGLASAFNTNYAEYEPT